MQSSLITTDNAISLSAAARLVAIDGKPPCPSTVWRWVAKGLNGVRLEHRRFGKRLVTSKLALDKFSRELALADAQKYNTADDQPDLDGDVVESEAQIAQELDALGL